MLYRSVAPPRALSSSLAVLMTLALMTTILFTARPASASLTTTIPYTGQLLNGSSPITGLYDFHFRLYDAPTGGTQVGSTLTMNSVPVADGVFYVELNFGSVFTGQTLYLQTAYGLHPASTLTTQPTRKLIAFSGESDYAATSGVSASTQALQGVAVSTTAPSTGQVLTYSGSQWQAKALPAVPTYKAGPGLSLSNDVFSIPNSGVTGPMLSMPLIVNSASGQSLIQVTNTENNAMTATSTGGNAVGGFNTNGNFGYLGDQYGHGVFGVSTNEASYGFLGGVDPSGQTDTGVYGSSDGIGVFGVTSGTGGVGVYGNTSGTGGVGVYGASAGSDGYGLYGTNSGSGSGVFGGNDGSGYGLYGQNSGSGYGVYGLASGSSGVGVFGESDGEGTYGCFFLGGTGGYAGFFDGNVMIDGTLTAAVKDFTIDDPLDPANKILNHSCIESDEMTNLYSGNVVTDARGDATVRMPNWFGALNKDFRYQLTVIGQFAQAIVSSEIQNNQFAIKTDKPGVKVSWQVTGVRQDAYAGAHPLQVEEDKPEDERGLYLNPTEQGQPKELGIGFAKRQRLHEK